MGQCGHRAGERLQVQAGEVHGVSPWAWPPVSGREGPWQANAQLKQHSAWLVADKKNATFVQYDGAEHASLSLPFAPGPA